MTRCRTMLNSPLLLAELKERHGGSSCRVFPCLIRRPAIPGTSKNPFERKRAARTNCFVKSPHLASASLLVLIRYDFRSRTYLRKWLDKSYQQVYNNYSTQMRININIKGVDRMFAVCYNIFGQTSHNCAPLFRSENGILCS